MKYIFFIILFVFVLSSCLQKKDQNNHKKNISGIYPHLAYYNNEDECGTGAVVPWEGRLWVITYGPHLPFGSSDKLYEISRTYQEIVHEESIGGTPANRMIHKESNQLFIGPYAIDDKGNVRVIPYSKMPGRLTGNARHLTDPYNKIYYATMEEGFYEVDVHTLEVKTIFEDGNIYQKAGDMSSYGKLLPGAHGKGLYSGQGVLVYSNNGESSQDALSHFDIESGVLAEWDGKSWTLIRRNQFVEVTGPGGIYGNEHPDTDPIWATGWDHKSILVGVREDNRWSFFRLPKASHSYDGAHGWNTEWPRIRDIGISGKSNYLMTMHGMFWKFPGSFTQKNSVGIRPRSAYLKVIGDFTRWRDQLVFGCDDSAKKEFLNKRKVKGDIEGPGQSNSNIWFTPLDLPDRLGPTTASGAVWLQEEVAGGIYSEPFLFAGWPKRSAWIMNHSPFEIEMVFEVDKKGDDNWDLLKKEIVSPHQSAYIDFEEKDAGEWIRVASNRDARLTVHFSYTGKEIRSPAPDPIFKGLLEIGDDDKSGGLLYGLGDDRKALGISAKYSGEDAGYYELNAEMLLVKKEDNITKSFIDKRFSIPSGVINIDESSVLIIDDQQRRWRLPKGSGKYDSLIKGAQLRLCREVATERDLFNCHGTFYELPAENADGFAKIRPIASHNFRIHDYASYRGMLIITGVDTEIGMNNPHIFISEDGKSAIWAGVIDDLWKMGKPRGHGGPWKNTEVKAGQPSDPYLIGFYDKKTMTLSHSCDKMIHFTVEVDPSGQGPWMNYMEIDVSPGETFKHQFPDNFAARWIRFTTNKDCLSTAWLAYQ